jgi:quinol-cytochrome oxidoreductase complex cytochrome b subunit
VRIKSEYRSQSLLELLALKEFEERLRTCTVTRDALTWSRFFGALLLVLLILLFLSGAFLSLNYSPIPGAAYDSVDYVLFNLPFGAVVKGIHHYAWNLVLIVMGLHLMRAFVLGAYKAPRQLVWVSGVLIMLIVPLLIITGDLLPWDQKGYWSTQVRLSIIRSVPVFGDLFVRLLQGGTLTGIVALTRFYILHILFLPGILLFLLAVHFHLIAHRGLSEPLSDSSSSRLKIPFLPDMVNRWLVLFLLVTIILGFISWYWPPPLGDPADPTDSTYVPKPEWWVLFLNQLVAIFKGPLTVIGSAVIPGLLAGLLIALPFLDRSSERNIPKRKLLIVIAGIIIVSMLILSVMGYIEHFGESHPK